MPRPMNSSVGPKPTRIWVSSDTWSGGLALTVTLWSSSSWVSPSSPKVGRWVVKSVTSLALPSFGGYFAALRKAPSIVSPVEVTSLTLPACTWSRKNVYDTVVRDVPISVDAMIQLTISASRTSHQVRRMTRPQLGLPAVRRRGRRRGALDLPRWPVGRPVPVAGRSFGRGGLPGRGGASVARPAIAFSPGSFARSATPTSPLVAVQSPTSPAAPVCPLRDHVVAPSKRYSARSQPDWEKVPCSGGERCGCWWSRTRCGSPPR